MNSKESNAPSFFKKISHSFDLDSKLLHEYLDLFYKNQIPVLKIRKATKSAERIVMVSTHGYWGDPPPAGVPDTGGQTYYVLETSKAWARQGRKVIILARWFEPFPRVERLAKNLWLIRIRAGGDEFVRKEDIYPLVPEMAEAATAISALFGAHAVMGHYADGMTGASEVAERLKIPLVNIPHSMGIRKLVKMGLDPLDPEVWFDPQYNFWVRESYEIPALNSSNLEIANTPAEPAVLEKYYHVDFPHLIMPAGAGKDYFDAFASRARPDIMRQFDLTPKKYLIFFGRLSEAKNISGVVAVLGEARRLNPKTLKNIKLALVGGNPKAPQEEEVHVEHNIASMMSKYDLTEADVTRIPSQDWGILSILAKNSLFYVGMQLMEPFGMAAAEAMASGAPIIISKAAGISRWLTDGEHALIVDPENPKAVAQRLVATLNDKTLLKNLSLAGRKKAKESFSWGGIAKRLGNLVDTLHNGGAPTVMNEGHDFTKIFSRRTGRAYHRLAFAWRGDLPIVKPQHKKAALGLVPYIQQASLEKTGAGERLIVALGGESGAGKSEVAEYLRFALRKADLKAVTVPGDAFFKLPPAKNHAARIKAHEDGRLKDYLGPAEVDLKKLESIIDTAKSRINNITHVPSDCRKLGARRYDSVPVNLDRYDVVLIDLTYSLTLRTADIRVFFESDYKKRVEEVRSRNFSRDPDQDFDFMLQVLEIEHGIIQALRTKSDLIITTDYSVEKTR